MKSIVMTKDVAKNIAKDVCDLVFNVTWGKQVACNWDGDILVFKNDEKAYEPCWQSMCYDIKDVADLVGDITGMELVQMDEQNPDWWKIDTFRVGLKWKED